MINLKLHGSSGPAPCWAGLDELYGAWEIAEQEQIQALTIAI
jgi:hypothetical protein